VFERFVKRYMKMLKEIKYYILSWKLILVIVLIVIGIYFLTIVPIIFGIILGAMAWLGLSIASRFINKYLAGLAISLSKITEARRYLIVSLPSKYDVRFIEPRGFINVLWNVFLFNLLGSFMVVRYFGIPSTDLDTFISSYLLAVFIASIIAFAITPIAVNISAIETTRFRVVDLDKMLVTYPAYLFYRLIKAIFGFGNLAVIVVIFANALAAAKGDIALGIGLFLAVVITTLSSVALGSLTAITIARIIQKDVIEGLMDTYDEALKPLSITSNEFLDKLKQELSVEEPITEKETIEETEKEKVEEKKTTAENEETNQTQTIEKYDFDETYESRDTENNE